MQGLVFTTNGIDRASARRSDEDWLRNLREDPGSRFLPLWQLNVLVKKDVGGLAWGRGRLCDSMDEGVGAVLLGVRDEIAHFAVDLSGLEEPATALGLADVASFEDIFTVAARLPPEETGLVAQARSMIDWHATHRFCPRCGARTDSRQAGALRVCSKCSTEHFPRVNPVAIMLVVRGDCCLLGRQRGWPTSLYSTLAGFIEPGETVEDAVRREVSEESGVAVGDVRYLSSQPWPFPSSLMIGCIAEATSEDIVVDTQELDDARWFEREELVDAITVTADSGQEVPPGKVVLPPAMAIGRSLIERWLQDG